MQAEMVAKAIETHRSDMIRFAAMKLRPAGYNDEDAVDMVSEMTCLALTRLETYNDAYGVDGLCGWLYTILINLCISKLRKSRRECMSTDCHAKNGTLVHTAHISHTENQQSYREVLFQPLWGSEEDLQRLLMLDDIRHRIKTMSGKLTPKQFEILSRVMNGEDQSAIGASLNPPLTQQGVSWNLQNAIKRLLMCDVSKVHEIHFDKHVFTYCSKVTNYHAPMNLGVSESVRKLRALNAQDAYAERLVREAERKWVNGS
jgi:RNA polymerase sigma factor (sigma-70 family)